MSDIWTFHPSSQEEVNNLKRAAAQLPHDENNKWLQKFKRKPIITCMDDVIEVTDCTKTTNEVEEPGCTPELSPPEEKKEEIVCDKNVNFDELIEIFENDPIVHIDTLIDECLNDRSLLLKLAISLSTSCIEKIYKYIYENKTIDVKFIEYFHELFIPNYLKREYNFTLLDILVGAHKTYPNHFKCLLNTIIQDLDIPNKALSEFINVSNYNDQKQILIYITELDLTPEQFVHNIHSIYTAYKNSEKTKQMQEFVLSNLSSSSHLCSNNKQYGRLLLTCLQVEKELKFASDYGDIEKIIDVHHSPFRRPCQSVFKSFNNG